MKTELERAGVRVVLVQGDITTQDVDVIVNAANGELAGGGGVDGAIHRAAGPTLMDACRQARAALDGPLPAGGAVITHGGELKAGHVVHAVGPVWHGGHRGEYVALERAYVRSLELAAEAGAATVAFPSISTGVYGFPIDRACFVALNTVLRFVAEQQHGLREVRHVLFSQHDFDVYAKALDEVGRTMLG